MAERLKENNRPEGFFRWVLVTVCDSGIGIPKADLTQLFSRFHRRRNAVEYPGRGLGLVIVQRIAETHGGDVTSVPQEVGACFVMRLPLVEA